MLLPVELPVELPVISAACCTASEKAGVAKGARAHSIRLCVDSKRSYVSICNIVRLHKRCVSRVDDSRHYRRTVKGTEWRR